MSNGEGSSVNPFTGENASSTQCDIVDDEISMDYTKQFSTCEATRSSARMTTGRTTSSRSRTASSTTLPRYMDQFLEPFREYIALIRDVEPDGNCGFRSVAVALGFGEGGWLQVRKGLLKELYTHADHYNVMFDEDFGTVLDALSHLENIPAPPDKWMLFPEMGHLVASYYGIVLHFICKSQPCTFFPLRMAPGSIADYKEIAIGHVNQCHFVQLFLKQNHPVPPIAPQWQRYRLECAKGWETPYIERMTRFVTDIIHPGTLGPATLVNLDSPGKFSTCD